MKRISLTLSALALACAAQAASLNVGCFNIRFQTASDQGDLDWNNRKEYVARTITEYGYDIVGINEMRVAQQLPDMKAMLPGYTFSGWGSDSATDPYTGTFYAVLFRTDLFDLLDEGHFFLSKDTSRPKTCWDCSTNKRLTVWAKLRVRETGEILFYFLTHLDHSGSDARNEGARINLEKIREIAGHYPAIITGDHNSSAIRYPFYDLFTAYMDDARKVSATPFPWTKDGTLCKWDPENKDTTRLDYIWVQGASVNTYIHINETFGRSVTPSDHFPIMANITLEAYNPDHKFYVSATAGKGGDGSASSPFGSLREAVERTARGDTVYVAAGDYSATDAGLDIPHSLTILGGYDSSFNQVEGLSRIDGKGDVPHVMTVQKGAALELSDFEIAGGKADGSASASTGAGIAALGARLDLRNVTVRDNYAKGNGAGVYAAGQLLCTGCRFERNISDGYGGGFYTHYSGDKLWWRFCISGCHFADNEAAQGSAAFIGGFSKAFVGHNTFSGNKARQNGTLALAGAIYESHTSLVNNTFYGNTVTATPGAINAVKGGSAVFAKLFSSSSVCFMGNTIVGNSSVCGDASSVPDDFRGGAVNIFSGTATFYGNIIGGNTTNAADGIADIVTDGSKVTTRHNAYAFTGDIDFQPNPTDITASSREAALQGLAAVYGATVADGRILASLADEGYTFPVLPMVSNTYCGNTLGSMPFAIFSESYTNIDVDGNADFSDRLEYDQRGIKRHTDGNSSLGAYEYGERAVSSTPYVLGTYNVRIATDTEPGKAWEERKEYVARTVTDADFDVVGLTEVLDGTQRTDLEALLPAYASEFHIVYSGGGKNQMNGVMWRADRFEALDRGMFYLSPDVTSSSIKFPGASQSRATVWVKLRDTSSDEVFYFFCCHLNRHEHAVAQKEGCRVIAQQIRSIAGDVPCVFVGDLNSLPGEPQVAGMLGTVMDCAQDIARIQPQEPLITLNFWSDDPANKYQFDYAYVRDFDVESCRTVNETYGRDLTPSDHIPFSITCSIKDAASRKRSDIFVAEGSAAGGDGSVGKPFASLAEALDAAPKGAELHLAAGNYTVPAGGCVLHKSLTIRGGYDASFSAATGRSIIAGDGTARLFELTGSNWLVMSGCDLTGGGTDGDGGAILAHGGMLDLADCTFRGNTARAGAAIATGADMRLERCGFASNTAAADGAAIMSAGGDRTFISACSFSGNSGTSAIAFASTASGSLATMVNTTVCGNTGGIRSSLPDNGRLNIVNCTVARNEAAAAIEATGGALNLHNNIIVANSALDASNTGTGKTTSAYNVYTSASDISFAAAKGDITATTHAAGFDAAAAMLGDLTEAGTTCCLPLISPVFDGNAVNALPYRELNEYAITTDLDGDFRTTTFTYLLTDQLGTERPADGTATRGACEYSATGAADIPAAPAELLEDCRIVDLAGRTIAVLGTVSRTEAMAYSGLQPGIYILCWRGGAAKIRY